MERADLLITGGAVWTPGGTVQGDVLVHEGKIVGIGSASAMPEASQVIDAQGQYVIPGCIDTHTHHREPGFTHKEDITTATRAAAAGGYTLSVGMPNVNPPTTTLKHFNNVIQVGRQKALVDFNHNPSGTVPEEVPKLAEAGCLAFKIFMGRDTRRDYPHMPGISLHDHGDLLRSFEAVAATGLPLMVHPHDQDLMDVIEQRYWQREDFSPQAYAKAYRESDGIIWDTAPWRLPHILPSHLFFLPGMWGMVSSHHIDDPIGDRLPQRLHVRLRHPKAQGIWAKPLDGFP